MERSHDDGVTWKDIQPHDVICVSVASNYLQGKPETFGDPENTENWSILQWLRTSLEIYNQGQIGLQRFLLSSIVGVLIYLIFFSQLFSSKSEVLFWSRGPVNTKLLFLRCRFTRLGIFNKQNFARFSAQDSKFVFFFKVEKSSNVIYKFFRVDTPTELQIENDVISRDFSDARKIVVRESLFKMTK